MSSKHGLRKKRKHRRGGVTSGSFKAAAVSELAGRAQRERDNKATITCAALDLATGIRDEQLAQQERLAYTSTRRSQPQHTAQHRPSTTSQMAAPQQ